MTIEIVDFPIENGDFSWYVNIYQRVTNGIEYSPAISGFLRHVRFPGPSVSPSAPCESGIASG